jgi:hypothetical protein
MCVYRHWLQLCCCCCWAVEIIDCVFSHHYFIVCMHHNPANSATADGPRRGSDGRFGQAAHVSGTVGVVAQYPEARMADYYYNYYSNMGLGAHTAVTVTAAAAPPVSGHDCVWRDT